MRNIDSLLYDWGMWVTLTNNQHVNDQEANKDTGQMQSPGKGSGAHLLHGYDEWTMATIDAVVNTGLPSEMHRQIAHLHWRICRYRDKQEDRKLSDQNQERMFINRNFVATMTAQGYSKRLKTIRARCAKALTVGVNRAA